MPMTEQDLDQLVERIGAARARQLAYQHVLRDAYEYAMPERNGWTSYAEGQERTVRVYDATATNGVPRFANRVQQALCPPGQRWRQLAPAVPLEGDEGEKVRTVLEAQTEILFAQLRVSNFDTVMNEACMDLAAGTMALLIENGQLGMRARQRAVLKFTAHPSSAIAIDEGPDGSVEGIFLTQRPKARHVRRMYPDATLPAELVQAMEREPNSDVELCQATTYDAEAGNWHFVVVRVAEKQVLVERRFRSSPWAVIRWSKAPGEVYGTGPLIKALPDIRVLNRTKEFVLKNASLAIAGVTTAVDDGITNPATVKLVPGAVIPVGSNGGPRGPSLATLPRSGNFDVGQLVIEQLQTAVRLALFDNPLPPEISDRMTATEVVERISQFQTDTGAFGRLDQGIEALVLRCLDVLDEAGILPGVFQRIGNQEVETTAVSPLAQAQNLTDVRNVTNLLQIYAQLGEVGAVMMKASLKLKEVGPWLAKKMGVPAMLIPTADEIAADEEKAEKAAGEQQLLQSPAVAQVAGAVARGAIPQAAAPQQQGAAA